MLEAALMLGAVLVILSLIFLVKKNKARKQGWKVEKGDGFQVKYGEIDENGNWRFVSFEIQLYSSEVPRHAVFVESDWEDFPDWAIARKKEILGRLRQTLKEPEYTIVER